MKKNLWLNIFMIISCVLNMIINPIALCWCIPMSIYVYYKIENNQQIKMFFKILSCFLVSPLVGFYLIGNKEY